MSAHQVDETAEVLREVNVFMFRIKAQDGLARFEDVAEDELEKIALALAGVAEDQNVRIRLVIVTLIKVHDDI